jgi:hypothetical protein
MADIEAEATPPDAEGPESATTAPLEPPPPAEPALPATLTPNPVSAVPLGRRMWTASLAAALLVASAGLGLLYVDDASSQNSNRALMGQNTTLRGENDSLQSDLTTTKDTLSKTQTDLTAAQAELMHPTLGIWNVAVTVQNSSSYLAAGVPDTFTYHLKLTSSGPMNVSIVSVHQFSLAVTCVQDGAGPTNYCMHHNGAAQSWLSTTSVTADFHEAEGCGGYLLVITAASAITVTPNVSVTYNPASKATGVCA